MLEPDEITGIKDSKKHISFIADLIGTTFRNRRLLLKKELLKELDQPKKDVVKWIYSAKPEDFGLKTPFYGIEEPKDQSQFEVVKRMLPNLKGEQVPDIQYVHKPAFMAFTGMRQELLSDIDGSFELSSGYRSPAFQILIFCYWIVRNEFDIAGTMQTIALPGYTEHGLVSGGALDFKLGNDIYLSSERAYKTAQTPEYKWLQKNAGKFGFKLSYPEGNELGMAFEPWHWRYVGD